MYNEDERIVNIIDPINPLKDSNADSEQELRDVLTYPPE